MTNEEQRQLIDQIRGLLDELETPPRRTRVVLFNGPYSGLEPFLTRQPEKIEIGKQTYVRIDDPDTGKTLDAYAWEKHV